MSQAYSSATSTRTILFPSLSYTVLQPLLATISHDKESYLNFEAQFDANLSNFNSFDPFVSLSQSNEFISFSA